MLVTLRITLHNKIDHYQYCNIIVAIKYDTRRYVSNIKVAITNVKSN